MLILGIETSCDETSAALVTDGNTILSSVIATQLDLLQKYGGVVPEIAARRHTELIGYVIKEALDNAGKTLEDLLTAIKENRAYVNVHTLPFPAGEIRGLLH